MLRVSNICVNTPRPAPYIESTANFSLEPAIKFKSANWQMASMYDCLKSTSSIAARSPFGIALALSSSSIAFMIAGGAEPPNLALNFTPFQFHGLWLEVMTTPPAAFRVLTASEMAGVGAESFDRLI